MCLSGWWLVWGFSGFQKDELLTCFELRVDELLTCVIGHSDQNDAFRVVQFVHSIYVFSDFYSASVKFIGLYLQ